MKTANVTQKEGDIFSVIRDIEARGTSETIPDPLKLRESLLVKRDLFRRLERVGYKVPDTDIQGRLNAAIHELDEIIKTTT